MPQGGADFGVNKGQSKKQTKPDFAIRNSRPHATSVAEVVEWRSERLVRRRTLLSADRAARSPVEATARRAVKVCFP